MDKHSIFADMPVTLDSEVFTDLLAAPGVRVERILSQGHTSPAVGWYEQDENEWVMVLQGAGVLEFEGGEAVRLKPGDYLNIPKQVKHRVTWTDPDTVTVWLAVFYP